VSKFYERASDIPKVDCPTCGGEHRPEAVAINFAGEMHDRYIAGNVSCPHGLPFDEPLAGGGQAPPVFIDEQRAKVANGFPVPVRPPGHLIPRGEPGVFGVVYSKPKRSSWWKG
jgi:hypothetical protein